MRRAVALGLAALLLAACEAQQKAVEQDLPTDLAALTQPGAGGGPILASIPAPPAGWSMFAYATEQSGRFTIFTMGDGVTVSAP
jgi:hypothetical protein